MYLDPEAEREHAPHATGGVIAPTFKLSVYHWEKFFRPTVKLTSTYQTFAYP